MRCVPLPEIPGDVLQGDVCGADLDRVTDLVPQLQRLLGRRAGLVHLIGDHALGGERVQQPGALSGGPRRGEPQRGAVVVHRFPV